MRLAIYLIPSDIIIWSLRHQLCLDSSVAIDHEYSNDNILLLIAALASASIVSRLILLLLSTLTIWGANYGHQHRLFSWLRLHYLHPHQIAHCVSSDDDDDDDDNESSHLNARVPSTRNLSLWTRAYSSSIRMNILLFTHPVTLLAIGR